MVRRLNVFHLLFALSLAQGAVSAPLRLSGGDMQDERATGNVVFYLHTVNNPDAPQQLFTGDRDSVGQSHFDKSRHTKIIIHGWGGSYTSSLNPTIRDAYLAQGTYNIIIVDWNPYAKLNYVSARNKVPVVGEDVAEFVDFLHDEFALNFDMLVVVGHSLGAHVAGYTGKFVKRGKIAAIVGLDPAFPLYSYENTETRLTTTDAHFVETIQTNGNMKGFLKPIGGASFYPHFGRNQPGCDNDWQGTCSHNRCVKLYVEALRGYSYAPIYKCLDFSYIDERDASGCDQYQPHVTMGDPLQIERVEGIFYLETNSEAPFGHFDRMAIIAPAL